MVGKRISALAFAVYGAAPYLAANDAKTLAEHAWIALGEAYERHPSLNWLQKQVPLDQLGYRVDGFSAVSRACSDGLGLAVLPCFLGDSMPQLRRFPTDSLDISTELWLLAHPDLRKTARVQAIFQILHEELAQQSALLQGHTPRPHPPATSA